MGPKPLWKRAAALLAAVGMSIFLAGGISADDGNAEAEAARVLKPTQAIADIPQEYDELFEIQWGGGSLYYLKARLATMGCMLNTIWVYDDNRWFSYNQYNVPHTLNQAFITQFSGGIPATTLYGTCINICTFDEVSGTIIERRECISYEEAVNDPSMRQLLEEIGIDYSTPCTDDFNPHVRQYIFTILPIPPNTCIIRQPIVNDSIIVRGKAGILGDESRSIWFISLLYDTRHFKSNEAREFLRSYKLNVEIHELCHLQQDYYIMQQLKAYTTSKDFDYLYLWLNSEANKEFMKLTGFTKSTDWKFQLSANSIFKEIYSINPIELSAELCTLYLLEKMGARSTYAMLIYTDLDDPEYEGYKVTKTPFDPSRYLTPQIIEWLETYMVLPYPNVEEEE